MYCNEMREGHICGTKMELIEFEQKQYFAWFLYECQECGNLKEAKDTSRTTKTPLALED